DNALKYTEQGSEICVSVEKQGGNAVIRVADDGNGIADDVKPHIFEMFYTGKNTVADSRRSFGIGLTLCKAIVELHGGTLTLADNVPHGCVFTFTLPLSEVTLNE
ncbi:MAG TPA: sensor histidine kinase, partial [Ruminococcaceae bacterium]|nr:sensor histidine kinase [Oscillospiraceae bacterium]